MHHLAVYRQLHFPKAKVETKVSWSFAGPNWRFRSNLLMNMFEDLLNPAPFQFIVIFFNINLSYVDKIWTFRLIWWMYKVRRLLWSINLDGTSYNWKNPVLSVLISWRSFCSLSCLLLLALTGFLLPPSCGCRLFSASHAGSHQNLSQFWHLILSWLLYLGNVDGLIRRKRLGIIALDQNNGELKLLNRKLEQTICHGHSTPHHVFD